MLIKGLKDEDFTNYSKPSMFIIFSKCTFKCDKENGCNLCQNSHLAQEPVINIPTNAIINRYSDNPITRAIVCGGLEPFDTPKALYSLLLCLRERWEINDDFVIYTGYTEEELQDSEWFKEITQFSNVIIKFGRFRPNEVEHYDEILGVKLASNNQYAKRYNYD